MIIYHSDIPKIEEIAIETVVPYILYATIFNKALVDTAISPIRKNAKFLFVILKKLCLTAEIEDIRTSHGKATLNITNAPT